MDIRESGEIEQNADIVLALYREDYYADPKPGQDTSETELWTLKNRDGARNARIKLIYNLKQQMFYPAAKELS
jgi:replicative DNA helicase